MAQTKLYMNEFTGSVDTEENWLPHSTDSLIEVRWSRKEETWVEAQKKWVDGKWIDVTLDKWIDYGSI